MSLTPKQQKILAFIEKFTTKKGYIPSQQEIADHFGYSSLGTVQNYLVRLEKHGYLKRPYHAKRALELKKSSRDKISQVPSHATTTIAPGQTSYGIPTPRQGFAQDSSQDSTHDNVLPLLGKVAAGQPIEAIEQHREVEVPVSMLRRGAEYFVLQVQGDSMIEDGIFDQDYVVVRKQKTASNSQTVVALINNEATIKRFQQKKGRIELHPANPNYQPIFVDQSSDFKIEGILAGVIRHME